MTLSSHSARCVLRCRHHPRTPSLSLSSKTLPPSRVSSIHTLRSAFAASLFVVVHTLDYLMLSGLPCLPLLHVRILWMAYDGPSFGFGDATIVTKPLTPAVPCK